MRQNDLAKLNEQIRKLSLAQAVAGIPRKEDKKSGFSDLRLRRNLEQTMPLQHTLPIIGHGACHHSSLSWSAFQLLHHHCQDVGPNSLSEAALTLSRREERTA